MVATLLDLSTGTPVAVDSVLNAQQPFGADVITRISATMLDPAALDRLPTLAQQTLAELAARPSASGAGSSRHEVYEVAVAGNATMTHLALGIDPEPLGVAPFIMSTRLYPEVLAGRPGPRTCTRAPARWSSPRSAPTSAATSRPGLLACGHGPGLADPAVRRHRHQLRDRARQPGLAAGHGGAGRARVRGRRDPVRDARRRRRHRGGHDDPGRRWS